MYAIVEISGKQFKVSPTDKIYVPILHSEVGSHVEFDAVKLFSDENGIFVGTPNVDTVKVTATVLQHIKDDKVIVYKKKKRKGYQRLKGHRQGYSQIEISSIENI